MDWPARFVIQKSGKSYAKLFESDDDVSLKLLQEHWKMNSDDQIIVHGEGEGGAAMICRKSYLLRISGYFRSFVGRWNNEADSTPKIKLENIPLDVFQNLLELASIGLLGMGDHNDLSTLVGAANFLEMADLSSRFSDLIRDEIKLCNSSVILWCYLTPEEYHGYAGLSMEASTFVKAKFEYILATCPNQLMDMSGKQWLDLVSDPNLFVVSENDLFRTICRWVALDPSNRSDEFVAATKYIRGGCLSENLLAEFRNSSSIPPVVRMLTASINASSEFQPRTVEVVAMWPHDTRFIGEEFVCYDPFNRSKGTVPLTIKFDEKDVLNRAGCGAPANVICLFRDDRPRVVDKFDENWIPEIAHKAPYYYVKLPSHAEATYLDGCFYIALLNKFCNAHGYFKFDCTDMISGNVSEISGVPDHIIKLVNFSLIGLSGMIHIFTRESRYTYNPKNGVWSAALPVIPPFERFPASCCIGPDGMIYINVFNNAKLWVFDAATSEFRISAACTEKICKILNVENKLVCMVFTKEEDVYASWVYDHVRDLWTGRQTIPFDVKGNLLPVRMLASKLSRED